MSGNTGRWASTTEAELLKQFEDFASQLGNPFASYAGMTLERGSPERAALVAQLHEAADELCRRGASPESLRIFESEDDAVRLFASTLLRSLDADLAHAGQAGVRFGHSTSDVLRLIQRAETAPKPSPDPSALSDDALVAAFADASTRFYATRFLDCGGDAAAMDLRNRIVPLVWNPARELKSRGRLDALLPLLDHPNDAVRVNAAIACLTLAPAKAQEVLETAAARSRDVLERADAKRSLQLWREGKTVVWGVV